MCVNTADDRPGGVVEKYPYLFVYCLFLWGNRALMHLAAMLFALKTYFKGE
jgi:hypothetical protein